MGWNHRVFRKQMADGSFWFDVRETYYDESGAPNACTADDIAAGSETLLGLHDELARMGAACSKPVLEYDEATNTIREVAK